MRIISELHFNSSRERCDLVTQVLKNTGDDNVSSPLAPDAIVGTIDTVIGSFVAVLVTSIVFVLLRHVSGESSVTTAGVFFSATLCWLA